MYRTFIYTDYDTRDSRGCALPPVSSVRVSCDEPGCEATTERHRCIGSPTDWDYGTVRAQAQTAGFKQRQVGRITRDFCPAHAEPRRAELDTAV